jgi:hypothetical protein
MKLIRKENEFMTIKQKQWQLRFLGYYGSEIDGDWGRLSQLGTIRFQQDAGLEPTGLFDEGTEDKSVEWVKAIQEAVGPHNPVPLVIDGLAGPKTMAATVRYQQAMDLTPDGIAGPLTRAALDNEQTAAEDFWDTVKYFSLGEFACPCKRCGGFPAEPSQKLVRLADKVREHFGAPAHVSSGVRCQEHNAEVGGVANSRHLYGKAMDFRVEGLTAAQVLAYVRTLPIRYAYAIDGSYVHMDVE